MVAFRAEARRRGWKYLSQAVLVRASPILALYFRAHPRGLRNVAAMQLLLNFLPFKEVANPAKSLIIAVPQARRRRDGHWGKTSGTIDHG